MTRRPASSPAATPPQQDPDPDEAAASPFACAGDNPLTSTDPTGHSRGPAPAVDDPYTYVPPPLASKAAAQRPQAKPPAACGLLDVACQLHRAADDVRRVYHAAVMTCHAAVSVVAQTEAEIDAGLKEAAQAAGHIAGDLKAGIADAYRDEARALGTAWHAAAAATGGVVAPGGRSGHPGVLSPSSPS